MDVVLVGFIAASIFGGFRAGLIRSVLGLLFMAISFVVGAYLRYPVGALFTTFFKDVPSDYSNLVGYTIVFPVVLAGLHIVSGVVLKKVAVRGIEKSADQALGAVFGGVEAILIISAAIVIVDTYLGTTQIRHTLGPGMLKTITDALDGSTTVHILRDTTVPIVLGLLGPLLPTDVSSLIPNGLPSLPGGIPLPTP
ncbi:MAG: CvpA family protein [Candidatus Limnocylindrales bacterium]